MSGGPPPHDRSPRSATEGGIGEVSTAGQGQGTAAAAARSVGRVSNPGGGFLGRGDLVGWEGQAGGVTPEDRAVVRRLCRKV
jgi:hypothetical protein